MKILEMFKEKEGERSKWSFSRVSSAIIILHYLTFSGYVAYSNHSIPDIPDNLYLLVASLYGVNKLAEVFKNKSNS